MMLLSGNIFTTEIPRDRMGDFLILVSRRGSSSYGKRVN